MNNSTESQVRNTVLCRLREDLIGPRAENEILGSRPSDVYLTGILWPKNSALAPEEDERLSVASGGEDDSEDAADQAQAHAVPMHRPSTAGISFATTAPEGSVPVVLVNISFGMYMQTETEGRTGWKRRQHNPEQVRVELMAGSRNIPFSSGELTGLRLNVRSVRFSGGMLATITLVNDLVPGADDRTSVEETTLFQVGMEIVPDQNTRLVARPSRRAPVDDEDWSSALLYRNAREFAAGHTCSADWTVDPDSRENVLVARAAWMPEAVVQAVSPDGDQVFHNLKEGSTDPLSARWLVESSESDLAKGLRRLTDAYEKWIVLQENNIRSLEKLFVPVAERHIIECRKVRERIEDGIKFIESSEAAREAFRLANLAMTTQREWAGYKPLRWRPFQLAFFLLTLESTASGAHPDRNVMDLLWFPTGGGKTEAYLGLIAFTAFYRRLTEADPDDGAGTAVIMRYTLRLLTTQQFIRAAAMICACEAIRRGKILTPHGGKLGQEPFSIGLWVGGDATPNSRQKAFDSLSDSSLSTPRQLLNCPCCGKKLSYVQDQPTDCVTVQCENGACLISDQRLPVWTVDDDVYAFRPTLLIGTVDKFAQIVRKADTAALFAVGGGLQPQLIVQDELHLISGPLGTVSGLYESAVDLILSANGTKPKIIGSTATIRRAPEQVLALFDRQTCQFPPPGLSAENSGFTVVDDSRPGRQYLGVTTAGRSAKFTLQAVSASLLQTASALPAANRDSYWTLLAYFNSLRELGGALVLMQDDVHDTIRLYANARNNETARSPRSVQELTSRATQEEIRQMLDTLKYPSGHEAALDVVLATNMVSVGMDIDRLGLMVVNGQPKTMAEYIQSTSRVGRSEIPGLVIPVLNNAKPRDRSHFETFRTWHSTIYREVEATSVTPFASRARDRALHAVLVAVIRHLIPTRLNSPVLDDASVDEAHRLIDRIAERANRIDPAETDVADELKSRLRRWIRRTPQQYWNDYRDTTSLLQAAEHAAAKRAAGRAIGQAWPTPNSMRGVEPSAVYRLTERLRRSNA